MPTKMADRLIPFTMDGDLHEWVRNREGVDTPLSETPTGYVADYRRKLTVKWKKNFIFSARLRVAGTERGRSAARFILEDDDGHRYPMFMTDMLALTERGISPGGYSEGEWTFCKRGQNYGITPVIA